MVSSPHDPVEIDALLDRALGLVDEGEAEATYLATDSALTRFAMSRIHQNVAEHDATLRVRLVHDGRTGVADTNRLDEAGLRELVERAAAIRDRAAANPEQAPLATPDGPPDEAIGYVEATAAAGPELRAAGAQQVIAAGEDARLDVAGAFSTETTTISVANTAGLRGRHTGTQAKLLTVMMGDGGASGYAQAFGTDVREIDASAVGEEAADRARRSADARALEAGTYEVVLEPYAVATLLEYLSFDGFSALAFQEGRSFMELGRRVMGETVTIWDDGHDPSGLPSTIDYEGVTKRRVDLISAGVATGLVHDTNTARRDGVASTGHGLPQPNTWGPIPWNLFMAPGSSNREAMIAGMKRGLWITRFHYVNILHPRKGILTGMTKDGTFLVEDGRVVGPVRNLRFTQSIPEAFSAVEAISADTKLVGAEYTGINARVPALKLRAFAFTGTTSSEEPG
jgi:predicted Zn-dependent protease